MMNYPSSNFSGCKFSFKTKICFKIVPELHVVGYTCAGECARFGRQNGSSIGSHVRKLETQSQRPQSLAGDSLVHGVECMFWKN